MQKIISKMARGGMTLVEVVVSISIFVLIALAISNFGADLFTYNAIAQKSLTGQQDARQILRDFASELRAALPAQNGAYPIAAADATSITFYSDVDSDGVAERVRYYMQGTTLKRETIEPTGTPAVYNGATQTKELAHDVANGVNPLFSYYDSAYDGTTVALTLPVSVTAIRLVRADISIEADPNRAPRPIVVSTQVSIRNIKDNLE